MNDSDSVSSDALNLSSSIRRLPGCDDHVARCLHRLGVRRARDLLFYFPRDYQDPGLTSNIGEMQDQQLCTLTADVVETGLLERGESCIFSILLFDGVDHLRCVWFNQPFHERRLRRGMKVRVTGKPRRRVNRWEMSHPQYEVVENTPTTELGLIPVYRLTEGVTQTRLRNLATKAVAELTPLLPDVLPESWRREKNLLSIQEAITEVHAPRDAERLEHARRRLAYQELLVLQAALALRQSSMKQGPPAWQFPATARIDARIKRLFPFELTPDQRQAIEEVARDMGCSVPMNRLLQGDVGVGKTVIAIYAMLLTVAHGGQAILMAPTEVLARQHMRTLDRRLRRSRVRMGLLTGSLSSRQRQELIDQAVAGELDLIVGTQAILHALSDRQDLLPKLGLVIIDEQHKFGVRQRGMLRRTAKVAALSRHDGHPHTAHRGDVVIRRLGCLVATAAPRRTTRRTHLPRR